jgi:alpha/beta superfamily hydrolase
LRSARPKPSQRTAITSPAGVRPAHGERDLLCTAKAAQRFYGTLAEPRELVVVDGADHFFDGHVGELADAIVDLLT